MKTTSSLQVLLAFLLASSLFVAPASAGPLLSDALLICSNLPSGAAGGAASPSITPDDPNVGNAACSTLCKKWLSTCKGAVAAARSCWLRSVGKVGGLRNATCNQLDGVAKDNCRATVKAEKDAAKDFIKNDAALGVGFCETGGLASCLSNCS